MDQHTGGKWLIHGIKHRKENRVQSLEPPPPVDYPSKESKHDTKESERNLFSPIFKENVQGQTETSREVRRTRIT